MNILIIVAENKFWKSSIVSKFNKHINYCVKWILIITVYNTFIYQFLHYFTVILFNNLTQLW